MSQFFLHGDYLAKQILMDEPYTREELIEDKSFSLGITLEEEEAIRLAKEEEERKERERLAAEQEAARKAAMAQGNANSYEDASQLRKDLCDFACQYVGLKYVMGGNSLETGTDCSGFTKLIYAHFGYGIDRTPSGQYNNNGRLISYAEAQPGDIIIYGKNGVCTHAAIYLGDGKIIHAANSRQNTYIGNATYNTIMGVKSIID
jgi:cell wall-associated NlpC family hydrolase